MNFNLKEITWQDAEKLEPGSKLWVGQTREKAVETDWNGTSILVHRLGWCAPSNLWSLHLTPYIPTPDAVDISPSEAAARMVEGLPVECKDKLASSAFWGNVYPPFDWRDINQYDYRIPACEPAKQKLTIEVDAGVEVPDEFRIWPDVVNATAKVIHREAK